MSEPLFHSLGIRPDSKIQTSNVLDPRTLLCFALGPATVAEKLG